MAENANPGGSIATLTQSPSGIPKDTLAKAVEGRLDAKRDSEQMADALDWLMEREADPDRAPEPKTLKLNLGTSDEPQWVRWVIVAVEDSKITAIREQSRKGGNRRQRRAGTLDAEIDEMQVARKMVVEGTAGSDRSGGRGVRVFPQGGEDGSDHAAFGRDLVDQRVGRRGLAGG
jgi:hypothetical protein